MELKEGALVNPTRTTARVYVGVDVSKNRLDVCLRWSEPESREELFAVAHDEAGIDTLVSRLLEEPPMLVILEATGGFERAVVGALAAEGLPVAVVNPRQVRSAVILAAVDRWLAVRTGLNRVPCDEGRQSGRMHGGSCLVAADNARGSV